MKTIDRIGNEMFIPDFFLSKKVKKIQSSLSGQSYFEISTQFLGKINLSVEKGDKR